MQRDIDLTENLPITAIDDPFTLICYSQHYSDNSKFQDAIDFAQKAKKLIKDDPILKYAAIIAENYSKIRFDYNINLTEEFSLLEQLQHHLDQSFDELSETDRICYQYFKAIYFNFRAIHYYFTSHYLEALDWLKQSFAIWEEVDDIFGRWQAYVNFTLIYSRLGKIPEALKYSDLVLENVDPDVDPVGRCYALISRAEVYELLADFESAFEYLNESYQLALNNNHGQLVAITARTMARLYWRQGNFKEVDDLQEKVLAYYKTTNNPHFLANIYNDIGNTKLHEKNYAVAKSYFQLSIEQGRKIDYTDELIKSYYFLILADVEADDPSHDLSLYLEQMEEYINQSENPNNNDYYKLSKALLFKHQSRVSQKFKAIELLLEIIHSRGVNFDVAITSIYHLTELLLVEYEFSSNPEVLTDLDDILDRLLIIANNLNSRPLKMDYYLLYSKLLLLLGDEESAIENLVKAQSLAEMASLHSVSSQIRWEINRITAEQEMLEDLNYISVPSVLGDFQDIQRYIKELQKGQMPELSRHLIDTPRMIMIISEGGLNLYAEQFVEDITSELNLVASFITAIRSFTEEVFTTSSRLEKISIGNDDLLVMPIHNLHLCYMYQGYTPSAINRLTIFTKTLEEHEALFQNLSHSTLNKEEELLLSQLTKIAFS